MGDQDVRELAKELARQQESPGDETYLRRGKVVSVTSTSAVVTIGGKNISNVPYYKHVTLTAGDAVDVLFDGPTLRIQGVLR